MPVVRPSVATGLLCTAAVLLSMQAQAQQVYRIVGPDGRVTYSDKPPLDATAKLAPVLPLRGAGTASAGLPFELQQVVSKYPVTLYTSPNCGACGSGRAFLTSRGIPFSERTVSSAPDAEALQRLAGESVVPLLTVGGQQIQGYSDREWGQFLDAAGYPSKSLLPGSWRNPPPSPMVAIERAVPPRAPAPPPAPLPRQTPPTPAADSADNPAGIKF